jgi:hypothetical protein
MFKEKELLKAFVELDFCSMFKLFWKASRKIQFA